MKIKVRLRKISLALVKMLPGNLKNICTIRDFIVIKNCNSEKISCRHNCWSLKNLRLEFCFWKKTSVKVLPGNWKKIRRWNICTIRNCNKKSFLIHCYSKKTAGVTVDLLKVTLNFRFLFENNQGSFKENIVALCQSVGAGNWKKIQFQDGLTDSGKRFDQCVHFWRGVPFSGGAPPERTLVEREG